MVQFRELRFAYTPWETMVLPDAEQITMLRKFLSTYDSNVVEKIEPVNIMIIHCQVWGRESELKEFYPMGKITATND